jgi:hypothetical protein
MGQHSINNAIDFLIKPKSVLGNKKRDSQSQLDVQVKIISMLSWVVFVID